MAPESLRVNSANKEIARKNIRRNGAKNGASIILRTAMKADFLDINVVPPNWLWGQNELF